MNRNEKLQQPVEQQYLDLHHLPFMPNIDDIIYFDGVNSLKVERWRIEFFQEEIFKGLEQAMTGVDIEREPHALFNTMLSIVRTPLFWDSYYTDEERRILEGEMS